jgi:Arc/MetJ-type ribon-helix-helix transcriptional regulator
LNDWSYLMTIRLPKDVERSIQAAVHSGDFASADEAVVAAWRSFQGRKPQHEQSAGRPLTADELNRRLLADGLISRLPNPDEDGDDDDVPVVIKGESLSETIFRERR